MSDELKPLVGSINPASTPNIDSKPEINIPKDTEDTEVDAVEDIKPVAKPIKPAVKKYAEPVAVDINAVIESLPEPAGPAVVGNGEVDDVLLSSCVYKNMYARKSLTVHHLQRRLTELGYVEAGLDKDGFYGDRTKQAVTQFQIANKLDSSGLMDAATFKLVFKGDPNVKVIL